MENKCCCTRVCAPALGVGFGITAGLFMMLFAWAAWLWGFGTSIIDQSAAVHYGYAATLVGGLIGGLWGLVEGFIFGLISGLIYNCVARCCGCSKSCSTCCGDKSSCSK